MSKETIKFIAEVSSNHNQDLNRCQQFIKTAAGIGCDGVKFQLFKIEKLFAPEIVKKSKEVQTRRAWELPIKFLPEISKTCKKAGIQLSCTPFYLEAVKELELYVDFYKIASYEILWHPLLKACAKTGKALVLSTGMAILDEIDRAMKTLKDAGARDITLLHCVSSYPAPPEECNLAAIKTLKDRYNCKVGWSDHSVNAAVVRRAVNKWQASMIEFHFDLDQKGDEFNIGHCWLPDQIAPVIANIRKNIKPKDDFTLADGDGEKKPVPSELPDRKWRADPSDGLRPLLATRLEWKKNTICDNNRPNKKAMKNVQLNRWSKDFGEAYTRRNLATNFSKKLQAAGKDYFSKALTHTKGVQKILEVGCNTGHNLLILSKIGNFELVGIDPQVLALKIGKEKGVPATLINGSVYDIPFFKGYFDLVITSGVLMHIHRRDLVDALKEIDRATNKYFLTIDYFDNKEVIVHYRGYKDMLWRRDMRKVCSKILPHMRLCWKKQLTKDPRTGKYTWIFLYEK